MQQIHASFFGLLYWADALALMLYTDTPTELCFLRDFRGQWALGCSLIIDIGCLQPVK